jgi:phage I-like protein
MMDYEHMSAQTPPIIAPASATHFIPEVRKDADGKPELWATQIVWTDKAAAHLRAGEYRLFSPLFRTDGGNPARVNELLNVGLTNIPALAGLIPLVAASGDTSTGDNKPKETRMATENTENKDEKKDGEGEVSEADKTKALTEKCAALEEENKKLKDGLDTVKTTFEKKMGKSFDDWAAEESAEHEDGGEEDEEAKALAVLKATALSVTGTKTVVEACGVLTGMGTGNAELVALKAKQIADAAVALEGKFDTALKEAIDGGKILPYKRDSFVALKTTLGVKNALVALTAAIPADPVIQLRAPREPEADVAMDAMYAEVASRVGTTIGTIQAHIKNQRANGGAAK